MRDLRDFMCFYKVLHHLHQVFVPLWQYDLVHVKDSHVAKPAKKSKS